MNLEETEPARAMLLGIIECGKIKVGLIKTAAQLVHMIVPCVKPGDEMLIKHNITVGLRAQANAGSSITA